MGISSTSQPGAQELLREHNNQLPVWIRPPKKGNDFWSGFSRSKLYELAKDGRIRSVSIREKPGMIKGTRLFQLRSILDYIEKLEGAK